MAQTYSYATGPYNQRKLSRGISERIVGSFLGPCSGPYWVPNIFLWKNCCKQTKFSARFRSPTDKSITLGSIAGRLPPQPAGRWGVSYAGRVGSGRAALLPAAAQSCVVQMPASHRHCSCGDLALRSERTDCPSVKWKSKLACWAVIDIISYKINLLLLSPPTNYIASLIGDEQVEMAPQVNSKTFSPQLKFIEFNITYLRNKRIDFDDRICFRVWWSFLTVHLPWSARRWFSRSLCSWRETTHSWCPPARTGEKHVVTEFYIAVSFHC